MLNLNVPQDASVMSMTKVPNVYRRTKMQNLSISRTACPGTSKKSSLQTIWSKSFQPMPFQNEIIYRDDYAHQKIFWPIFWNFRSKFLRSGFFMNFKLSVLAAVKIRAVAISKFWNLDFLKRIALQWSPSQARLNK